MYFGDMDTCTAHAQTKLDDTAQMPIVPSHKSLGIAYTHYHANMIKNWHPCVRQIKMVDTHNVNVRCTL